MRNVRAIWKKRKVIAKKTKERKISRVSSVSFLKHSNIVANASHDSSVYHLYLFNIVFLKIVWEERRRQVESETIKRRSRADAEARDRRDRRLRPENSVALTVWLCGYATTVSPSSLVRLSVDLKPRCGRPLRCCGDSTVLSRMLVGIVDHLSSCRRKHEMSRPNNIRLYVSHRYTSRDFGYLW